MTRNIPSSPKKSTFFKNLKEFLDVFFHLGVLTIVIIAIWMQQVVFKDLPNVETIQQLTLPQTTVITDRNGIELYKFFNENREHIPFSGISTHMINAIVAIEDQYYWRHEWFDMLGVIRVLATWKGGASTIPQQLMTNIFWLKQKMGDTQKDKIIYKLRQIALSLDFNLKFLNQTRRENPSYSESELKFQAKKDMLELYLNYIEFWNTSFWIEAASKAYFQTSASDITIAQSAILASLPKGPTQYSPLITQWRKNLMGYFELYNPDKDILDPTLVNQTIISAFQQTLSQINLTKKSDFFSDIFLPLTDLTITIDHKEYQVSYINGRKDVVLTRMLEDEYITLSELKQALVESLSFSFAPTAFSIKAPHFIFRVKEQLEQQYGLKAVLEWGMIVRTTLDYTIQQQAEQLLLHHKDTLHSYGANNASLLYLDSNNGDVLAYVGSLDYFDEDIQGQNDMIRLPRQSGSALKPLIYALAFERLWITQNTIVYDTPLQIGSNTPQNADGRFRGRIPVRIALGQSRNIPAIRIFQDLGGESIIKPYFQSLGLKSLSDEIAYGYTLALGAGEVPLLEVADAYGTLVTYAPAEINPILHITESTTQTTLYQKQKQQKSDQISESTKKELRSILSNPYNRFSNRVNLFTVHGLGYALKTGTSNIRTPEGNRPRDGVIVAYMQDKILTMRAGNTDASPMNASAYGGLIHAETTKQFLSSLLEQGYLQ